MQRTGKEEEEKLNQQLAATSGNTASGDSDSLLRLRAGQDGLRHQVRRRAGEAEATTGEAEATSDGGVRWRRGDRRPPPPSTASQVLTNLFHLQYG